MAEEFEARSEKSLFDEKVVSLTDGWKCLQIESPAGTWFLVSEKSLAKKFWQRKNSPNRAVFTRAEMHQANKGLEQMMPENRQKWLSSMIDVKEVFEGAVIHSVESIYSEGAPGERESPAE